MKRPTTLFNPLRGHYNGAWLSGRETKTASVVYKIAAAFRPVVWQTLLQNAVYEWRCKTGYYQKRYPQSYKQCT